MAASGYTLTSYLRATRLPWKSKSRTIGLSTLLFVLPALKKGTPTWKRVSMTLQAYVSYLSDYAHSGDEHLSHGLDRLLAAFNVAVYTPQLLRGDYWWIPLACFMMSMSSIRLKHWEAYVLWHTLWHITGVACLYA